MKAWVSDRTAAIDDLMAVDRAKRTVVEVAEGVGIRRVEFRHVEGCIDAVLQADEDAHAARAIARRDADSGEDILGAVRREIRGAAHRPCHADRLLGVKRHVEEEGGLFQTVRAVRHDEAIGFICEPVDGAGKGQHLLGIHPSARDIGKFDDVHVCPGGEPRYGCCQVFPGDGRYEPAGHGIRFHGDGAAGGDDDDMFFHRESFFL